MPFIAAVFFIELSRTSEVSTTLKILVLILVFQLFSQVCLFSSLLQEVFVRFTLAKKKINI